MNISLKRLSDLSEYLVDRRVGIIGYVGELPRHAGAPDFFHFFARACNTKAFGQFENFNNAGGASISRDLALAKAVGEAVERYCSAIYDLTALPLCSYEEAPFPCVPPAEFALHSPEQYEQPGFMWVPFEESTPIRWTAALDPLTGESVHVPAAMVYMPYYYYRGSGDTPICQPISTGMACHCSPAEAAIAAASEVIERDALMITWQAMLSMPHIAAETLSDENYDRLQRFERLGGQVTLLDITLDVGMPTVLSVLSNAQEELPARVFAASSALSPETAVRQSLEELAHTRRYCHAIKSWLPRIVPNPPSHDNVVDQLSHLNFWTDQRNAHLADFLLQSKIRMSFDDMGNLETEAPGRDLEVLCLRVRAVGHRLLLVDLTTPDVRDLGITVIRALIPGFQPLFMSYRNRSLGGTRLWTVPQKLGHGGIDPQTGDNPSPHMYP